MGIINPLWVMMRGVANHGLLASVEMEEVRSVFFGGGGRLFFFGGGVRGYANALKQVVSKVYELWSGNYKSIMGDDERSGKPWLISFCGDGGGRFWFFLLGGGGVGGMPTPLNRSGQKFTNYGVEIINL